MHILVIDDEKSQRNILKDILKDAGYTVMTAENGDQGIAALEESEIHLVLTDLKMPGKDGSDVLKAALHINPDLPVIIMTAFGSIPSAVSAMKNGAYDYLTKPFKKDELLHLVKRACEKVRLISENRQLKNEISGRYQYDNIIGKSPAMLELYKLIERIKDVDATVLICGASGTGKELVARAIHYSGKRRNGPFIAINCGAIPDTLIESELFGHEKGAFTGADRSYTGKFEQAQGGTILLDEIGTMRPDLQIKLLRVLQERKIEPVGSNRSVELDVRVIAATNENLDKKVKDNSFRMDLYHRLNVFRMEIPDLADRKEDIVLLANYFLKKYALFYGKDHLSLSKEALNTLENYKFPGNVRELENIIEKAAILSDSLIIDKKDLMIPVLNTGFESDTQKTAHSLPEFEEQLIHDALRKSRGSLKQAAQTLGITYKTLQYRIKKFGINKDQFKN